MDEAVPAKSCLYCGADNPEGRKDCVVCHQTLISEEEITQAQDELIAVRHPPDMAGLHLNFEEENGISHPDWRTVIKHICETRPRGEWWDVCHELAKQWLAQLKADLGGNYHLYESESFLVLCAEGPTATRTMLGYAESSLAGLKKYCQELFPNETYGKRAILIFTDQDDYYAYVSHFHSDGSHSLSSGMMLGRGYIHVALPFTWIFSAKRVIAHELVHNCIAHLPIPSWLHEGLAQKLEGVIMNQGFKLEHELVVRHQEHWNEQNIQEFWSGASFYVPDERNKLSYSLAEILTEFLSGDWKAFLAFILQADHRDAGQDASIRILSRCLGETVGQFLGPGNWRPQRKAIAEWRKRRSEPKVQTAKILAV